MKYRKIVPVLQESPRTNKRHGHGHKRVTIPKELDGFIKISSKDFIEWEVDTNKKTLIGRLIRNDVKKRKKK